MKRSPFATSIYRTDGHACGSCVREVSQLRRSCFVLNRSRRERAALVEGSCARLGALCGIKLVFFRRVPVLASPWSLPLPFHFHYFHLACTTYGSFNGTEAERRKSGSERARKRWQQRRNARRFTLSVYHENPSRHLPDLWTFFCRSVTSCSRHSIANRTRYVRWKFSNLQMFCDAAAQSVQTGNASRPESFKLWLSSWDIIIARVFKC
jgi:hypothetical protein